MSLAFENEKCVFVCVATEFDFKIDLHEDYREQILRTYIQASIPFRPVQSWLDKVMVIIHRLLAVQRVQNAFS